MSPWPPGQHIAAKADRPPHRDPGAYPILRGGLLIHLRVGRRAKCSKSIQRPPIFWRPPVPPYTPPSYRRLEEFFIPDELEEMQEPGYFDEIEEILKKTPS